MLRYETNTAFHHSLWDRYEYLGLMKKDSWLEDRDFRHRQEHHYSLPQESFYALLGRPVRPQTPTPNATLELWGKVINRSWFTGLQKTFRTGLPGQLVTVRKLTLVIESGLQDEENPLQMLGQGEDEDQENSPEETDDETEDQDDENSGEDESEDDGESDSDDGDGDENDSDQGENDESDEDDDGEENSDSEDGGAESGDDPDAEFSDGSDGSEQEKEMAGVDLDPNPGPQGKSFSLQAIEGQGQRGVETVQAEAEILEAALGYAAGIGGVKETLDLAQEIAATFDVRRISKFLGFVKNAVKAVHRNGDATSGNLTGYRHVEWATQIHPADMIGIAQQDMRALAKVSEGTLRARKYESKKPMGRGPVILLRDESSSMMLNPQTGNNEYSIWMRQGLSPEKIRDTNLGISRELEFSLAVAFNGEKRDFISIAWDDSETRQCTYGEDNVKHHLSQFLAGGTAIHHALEKALDLADEYVKGADILVLTDGEISRELFNEDQQKKVDQFKENGGRMWVIFIGQPVKEARLKDLKDNVPWADATIHIDQINESTALEEMLTAANRREIVGGRKRL